MMTRDEAVKRAHKIGFGANVIDLWVALGMLKLDEPKSAVDKFCDAYHGRGCTKSCGPAIEKALDIAGLRIAEK